MMWPYSYTPYIWPMLASAAFMVALATYGWWHRSTPGALSFTFLMMGAAMWALGSAFEVAAADLPAKLFWFKFEAVWRLPMAIAAFCFALEYSGHAGWLTRRNLALLIAPALALFPFLFVEDFSLFWTQVWMAESVRGNQTALGLALNAYGIALIVMATAIFAILFFRSPLHRQPVALILLGHLAPRIVYPLEVLKITASSPIDLTMLSFNFTAAMYAVALFRFRLFDVVPVARETVLERMVDGMLVLDAANRVADINPAAQEILDVRRSRALGQDAAQLLEGLPGLAALALGPDTAGAELAIGQGKRWYQASSSPLTDRRGFRLGRLIVLRDVTQLKRTQERLFQQQRALAAVQERERVARELHDGVGQVLGYVSMQVDAARKLLEDEKVEIAGAQLARLASVARDAHADLREEILSLRSAPSEQRPFLATLGHYLDGFSANYEIRTGLEVAPGFDERALEPEAQSQLLRIIQEALSNARKHGAARSVRVQFDTEDGLARVAIQDDGSGFDPGALSEADEGRFGLQFMRERAEGLGGRLEVRSAPSQGTRVVVELPLAPPDLTADD